MSKKVRFMTLGCKVNQYETQAMRESLERAGIYDIAQEVPESQSATSQSDFAYSEVDFVVLNTCTVTKVADRENLYWVRRLHREHPKAKMIVTGCFAEHHRREMETIPEIDLVLGNEEKNRIASYMIHPKETCQTLHAEGMRQSKRIYSPLSVSRSEGRSRAYIKIQDGCNHACSFCKVVLVRGRSRSRPIREIMDEAKRLRDSGYREVVFTGIQLGAYGHDLAPRKDLCSVLEMCSEISGLERMRLSSIEPMDVTDSLMEALCNIPQCCPHLHISLQSGDDDILKRMNRHYSAAFYRDLIARLKSEVRDFSLTLDVMAGFPGEEEAHFQNTIKVLQEVQPLKCHVFPYSQREGTRAAQFSAVPNHQIHQRVRTLVSLSDRLGLEVRSQSLGKTVQVLVEKKIAKGRLLQGFTPNYLRVGFEGSERWIGQIVPVKIESLEGLLLLGKMTIQTGKQ